MNGIMNADMGHLQPPDLPVGGLEQPFGIFSSAKRLTSFADLGNTWNLLGTPMRDEIPWLQLLYIVVHIERLEQNECLAGNCTSAVQLRVLFLGVDRGSWGGVTGSVQTPSLISLA